MKKFLALAALIAALAPIAQAEPANPSEIRVSAAGLDLNNPADAGVMIARLEAAVRPHCIAPGYAIRRAPAGCVRDAVRAAVARAKIPQLTTAFNAPAATKPTTLLAQR